MKAVALVVAALAVAPSIASATVVQQTFTGTNCNTAYGEDQTLYGDDGGIYSASSTWWRTALCPLNANPIYRYWVNALDRNYSLDVSCRVLQSTAYGVVWSTATTTTGSSPQAMTLQAAGYWSTFSNLLCYLPQTYQGNRSAILGYSFETWVP